MASCSHTLEPPCPAEMSRGWEVGCQECLVQLGHVPSGSEDQGGGGGPVPLLPTAATSLPHCPSAHSCPPGHKLPGMWWPPGSKSRPAVPQWSGSSTGLNKAPPDMGQPGGKLRHASQTEWSLGLPSQWKTQPFCDPCRPVEASQHFPAPQAEEIQALGPRVAYTDLSLAPPLAPNHSILGALLKSICLLFSVPGRCPGRPVGPAACCVSLEQPQSRGWTQLAGCGRQYR